MPEFSTASTPADLPRPSAVAILYRVQMTHWLIRLPKEEAIDVLRGMAEDMATEQSLSNVLLLRPPPDQAEQDRERRGAIALFRWCLPVWLAAIDAAAH